VKVRAVAALKRQTGNPLKIFNPTLQGQKLPFINNTMAEHPASLLVDIVRIEEPSYGRTNK